VTDDKTGAKESFPASTHLRESYEAAVMVVSATTTRRQRHPWQDNPVKTEYWDYGRDLDIGGGHSAKEFLFRGNEFRHRLVPNLARAEFFA